MLSGMNQTLRNLWGGTLSKSPGSICLKYRKGNLIEVTKPTELKWHPAHGTNKCFQTLNDITDTSPMSLSKPHKVKGFADDLTIISASSSDHSEALKAIPVPAMI